MLLSYTQAASNGRKINLQEVQKHDNEDDCWIAVDGKVTSLPAVYMHAAISYHRVQDTELLIVHQYTPPPTTNNVSKLDVFILGLCIYLVYIYNI